MQSINNNNIYNDKNNFDQPGFLIKLNINSKNHMKNTCTYSTYLRIIIFACLSFNTLMNVYVSLPSSLKPL